MSEHPQAAPPAAQGADPARKRPRGFETAADMVRTMAVILALVLVVFFLGARPQGDLRAPPDVAATVAQAQAAGLLQSEPVLPEGWKASNTRFGPDAVEGLPSFHVGYLDPAGQYGGIDVTRGVTPAWIEGVAGEAAVEEGVRDLDDRRWQVWANPETGGTTLVDQAGTDAQGTLTITVTSRGDDAALEALAAAVDDATTLWAVAAAG